MRVIKFSVGIKSNTGEVSSIILTIDELLDKGLKCQGCEILYKRQFTGLTDVNGVEIYEDDIVSIVDGGIRRTVEHRYTVQWSGDAKWVAFSSALGFFDLFDFDLAVISNIHKDK